MKTPFPESIRSALQKTWADSIASVRSLQDEMTRRLHAMSEWQAPGSDEVQRALSEWRQQLQQSREQLERRLEGSVRAAVAAVRDPVTDEVAALKARAESLSQRVEAYIKRREADDPGEQDGESGGGPPRSSAGAE